MLLHTSLGAVKIPIGGDENHARLRAFPPQAVLGPCFSTGSQGPVLNNLPLFYSALSRPFTGVLFTDAPGGP